MQALQVNEIEAARERLDGVRREVGRVYIGDAGAVDVMLLALLARGHVLLEGVPGVAKTTLVKAYAAALGATVRHYDLRRVLAGMRRELEARSEAMAGAARNLLLQQRGRLERIGAALEALSPVAILERGYALVFDAEGKLVKDPGQVRAGDAIVARLAKGRVRARVEGTE